MRFRKRGVEQAKAGVETVIATEKRGNKADEQYARVVAVRKEGGAREREREDARKGLVLFERFEAAMKQAVPELLDSQPDLLSSLLHCCLRIDSRKRVPTCSP